ncbi:uncharacterized protein LOC143210711 [Lasioglossum baleicum]|uniref:uncharacterized protein LOC143210711 n=1 Tax=Lasioglossum baleicum TaxID=434251 RepID=UPI003FCCC792
MKYLLCLVVAIACEAGRVSGIIDHGHFQSYQGGFPYNDASGYQHGIGNGAGAAFFGDFRGHEGNLGLGTESFPHQGYLGGRQDLHQAAGVPFGDVGAGHANLGPYSHGRLGNDYNFPGQRFY